MILHLVQNLSFCLICIGKWNSDQLSLYPFILAVIPQHPVVGFSIAPSVDPSQFGQQYSGANGDADVVGLPGIHIEVKRREKLNIYDAIDQAKRERKLEELPAVFHRKNHCEWLVTMPFDEWMKIYREWEAGRDA